MSEEASVEVIVNVDFSTFYKLFEMIQRNENALFKIEADVVEEVYPIYCGLDNKVGGYRAYQYPILRISLEKELKK